MIGFSKYHGCGNNFIIVKEAALRGYSPAESVKEQDYPTFARKVCDINTGVGADGLIIVRQEPALEMVFYNCDGSRAPMCGNGIRCFARYCMEEGIRQESSYTVKTLAGDMVVTITCKEPFQVRINMGKPVFAPEAIGVDSERADFLKQTIVMKDGSLQEVNSLFMGTVHTVVFVDSYDDVDVPVLGREICNHPVFKEKTNVNFVKRCGENVLAMQTYERGVGMTLACGTGACASAVVAELQGLCRGKTEVKLALGSLMIEKNDDGTVSMEGPAVKILDGTLC